MALQWCNACPQRGLGWRTPAWHYNGAMHAHNVAWVGGLQHGTTMVQCMPTTWLGLEDSSMALQWCNACPQCGLGWRTPAWHYNGAMHAHNVAWVGGLQHGTTMVQCMPTTWLGLEDSSMALQWCNACPQRGLGWRTPAWHYNGAMHAHNVAWVGGLQHGTTMVQCMSAWHGGMVHSSHLVGGHQCWRST